jgi:tubulysin polyketide synthase-like protein
MTPLCPSAARFLADLAQHGIEVQPHGDAIRYRPRSAMTPALLEQLQAHKVMILAMAII